MEFERRGTSERCHWVLCGAFLVSSTFYSKRSTIFRCSAAFHTLCTLSHCWNSQWEQFGFWKLWRGAGVFGASFIMYFFPLSFFSFFFFYKTLSFVFYRPTYSAPTLKLELCLPELHSEGPFIHIQYISFMYYVCYWFCLLFFLRLPKEFQVCYCKQAAEWHPLIKTILSIPSVKKNSLRVASL